MTSDEISRILAHSWDLLLLRLLWSLIMLFRSGTRWYGSGFGFGLPPHLLVLPVHVSCWNTPFSHQAGRGEETCCAFMIRLIRAHREQIRAIWLGGFVGLGEIPSPPPPSSVRFNTAASMYGFSLCLRRGPCAECASRARAVAGLSCGSETFGERAVDAGRDAHGCGAAQPAAVDGRRVRTAASERADAGAIQARQVSSRVWKLWKEQWAEDWMAVRNYARTRKKNLVWKLKILRKHKLF